MDLQSFRKPDSILRPAPFWAINDRITPEETARQMEDMINVGLSGGFFHSRHGLITDYLSDEWFDSMKAALEVAKTHDGYLWLYDEDLWPSGNAGGQVAGMKDEYRAALLKAVAVAPGEPAPELTEDQAIRYCYAIKSRDGVKLNDIEAVPLADIDSVQDSERLFFVRTYQEKTGWWSGESYANLLDPQAMQEFVRLTHDVYYAKLGDEFGKRIPGIFTDEPQISWSHSAIAWYEGLPDVYAKWMGRDFWADLPYMFFEGPESRKIRLLVHRAINRQFVEAYSKPIFEWCEKHNIEHTGHYMLEDDLSSQVLCHAGGVMAHYRYQHAPGIDHLCRQNDGMLMTVKQVSSAARQLGRTRVLDEIFGVSRHTNTFEDFKWLGDFDLVHGANFFVPHLTWYSAKGRRKRDYPPVWNYQQTYWKELNPLNDYFTRVAHALTQGKAAADIVMLHPIESATAARSLGVEVAGSAEGGSRRVPVDLPGGNANRMGRLSDEFTKSLDAILTAGYDCDLGDEGYIEDMGAVKGDSFIIGEMSYKIVVIPPSTTWRPGTFELLKQFAANGGKVLIVGDTPTELDCGDAKSQCMKFAISPNVYAVPRSTVQIQNKVDEIAPKPFTLKGKDGRAVPKTYVQRRVDTEHEIFFIVNSDRESARDYVLTLPDAEGKTLTEWDPVHGNCETLCTCDEDFTLRFDFNLPPCGSLLLTFGGEVECDEEIELGGTFDGATLDLPDEFDFERCDDNVLVIDRVRVSFDGGKTFDAEDLDYRVRGNIAERFGTKPALSWQPWVAIRKKLFDGKGGDIVLRYRFVSDIENPKAFAVIEDLQKGKLAVNGSAVDTSSIGWHWDRGFGKVEITPFVKKGENVMDFSVSFDFLTEIEPAYVVGDFGVEMADLFSGKIISEPEKLKIGSWTEQGYPFYSGRMIYKTTFEAVEDEYVELRLIRPSGTLYKVRLNGADAGSILWRPYELDMTPLVKAGENELEIEVISSLQNSWGPLHEKTGDDNQWCGPIAFEEDSMLRDEMNIYPYGLLGGIEIVSG